MTFPTENAAFPTENVAFPTENVACATENAAFPTENAACATENAAFPTENAAFATENVAFPTENAACATENAAFPTENATCATENAAFPTENAACATENAAFSTENAARATENVAFSTENVARTIANATHATANMACATAKITKGYAEVAKRSAFIPIGVCASVELKEKITIFGVLNNEEVNMKKKLLFFLLLSLHISFYSFHCFSQSPVWIRTYRSGALDSSGHFMGGNEITQIVAHKGKLFAGNSDWEESDTANNPPECEIVRLDNSADKWQVDTTFKFHSYHASADSGFDMNVNAMKSFVFTSDYAGNTIQPDTLLIAAPR